MHVLFTYLNRRLSSILCLELLPEVLTRFQLFDTSLSQEQRQ